MANSDTQNRLETVLSVAFPVANGVYQNSVYGTAAVLPMKYTNAVVLGSVSVALLSRLDNTHYVTLRK